MGKVEDLALEKYPQRSVLVVPARGGGYYADSHLREGFIDGYHQAEKDLELTWGDIKLIIDIVDSENLKPHLFDEIDYQEILRRFKERKEK